MDAKRFALDEGEKILWEGEPVSSVVGIWFLTKGLWFAFMGGFLVFWCFGFFGGMWAAATKQEQFNPFLTAVGVLKWVVPLCLAVAFAYLIQLRRSYRYFVTNQRVVFIGGLLRKKRRSVHYHKVTDVEVSQNLLEQIAGLRSLKIFTAGTSGMGGWGMERAEIEFQGLKEADQAERLINNTLKSYRATGE